MKIIAITAGDINGIGPEVVLKALTSDTWPSNTRFVIIGHAGILSDQAQKFGSPVPPEWSPACGKPPRSKISVWDPDPSVRLLWEPGTIRVKASRQAIRWIEEAVHGCMSGNFDAMVTAPICKEGLKKAGMNMPGHTEYLAELTGTKRYAMMLIGGGLRVILVTRHIPLSRVASSISKSNVLESIRISAEALPWLGCRRARIGVCGLNPHAGDGGVLGTEEKDIIAPAVKSARRKGMLVEGPIAPDAIFYQALHGAYDVVVAMYHDQGLGPLKMIGFDEGVNITLGLPIVRTSPDHGTAFDVAGKGSANPDSMIQAIKLACKLSRKTNPWRE